jgi:hypothetical protein
MTCFRLYLPAIVLAVWAVTWALGLRDGNGLLSVWLIVLATASFTAERERVRQRRKLRHRND